MTKATFVIGLPGSGKSHFIKVLAEQTKAQLFDDYKANAIGDCSLFPFSRKYIELINFLREGRDCIISDIDFCREIAQREAQLCLEALVSDIEILWICFENNPSQCKQNVYLRATYTPRDVNSEINNIHRYSQEYHTPRGANIVPVWKKEEN